MAASNRNLGSKKQGDPDREETEKLSGKPVGDAVPDEKGLDLDRPEKDEGEEDEGEEDEGEEDEEEVVDEDYEAPLEDDDFISDVDDAEELVADQELSPKEQGARSLAIRRAIEQRMEQKKLDEDLDYLDLDLDS